MNFLPKKETFREWRWPGCVSTWCRTCCFIPKELSGSGVAQSGECGCRMTPGCIKIHVSSCNKNIRELFCDKCHRCALHHLLAQGEHEMHCQGPEQCSSPDKPCWHPSGGFSGYGHWRFFPFLTECKARGGLTDNSKVSPLNDQNYFKYLCLNFFPHFL